LDLQQLSRGHAQLQLLANLTLGDAALLGQHVVPSTDENLILERIALRTDGTNRRSPDSVYTGRSRWR